MLVPANATVLLDVSPPLLYAVVLEGKLVFDDEATEELHLQVGGMLSKSMCFLYLKATSLCHKFFCVPSLGTARRNHL